MTATIRGMAETIPDGSRRRRRYDGGVAVDDGRRRKLYGTEGAYTEPIRRLRFVAELVEVAGWNRT